jgi:hypothetical protein
LTVNATASLTGLGASLDGAIPPSYNTDTFCGAPLGLACVQGYLGREPLRLNLSGNHLSLKSMIHYELDGNFLFIWGSCGKPDNTRRRANVAYDANISLSPTWMLSITDAHAVATAIDKCEVTVGNRDVTDQAIGVLNNALGSLTQSAAQKLQASTALYDSANEAWHVLSSPIVVDGQSYLELHPQSVGVAPIVGANEALTTAITVNATPVISLGTPPPAPNPLPDVPQIGPAPADDQVHLMAVVKLPFDAINQLVSKAAVGKEFSFDGIFGKRTVKIVKTTVTGGGDKIAVGLDLDGWITGTAWVVGQLKYSAGDRKLTIELTDVDVDTRNVLVKVAKWFSPDFLLDAARSAVGTYSLDVGEQSDEWRARARQALNRQLTPTVAATATIGSPEIRGPFSDQEAFLFTVGLTGRLQINITPAGGQLAVGNEIRYVSVLFETSGDDKDAEEPVDLYLTRNGAVIAQRQVGVTERWGDNPPENQGPYFLTVPLSQSISDCHAYQLRVFKEPRGSETGKGWKNVMHARLYLANGTDIPAAKSPFDQWGDGHDHPWDRTFALCDPTP